MLLELPLVESANANRSNSLNAPWPAEAVVVKLMLVSGPAPRLILTILAAETSLLAAQPSAVHSAGNAVRFLMDFAMAFTLAFMVNAIAAAIELRPLHLHVGAEFRPAVADAEGK